ncbi:hypothetical protein [Metapseudomonas otitidis]|uniref:hypothetical protein n=1 Tax=Metapseudomonas otitidis TaxID=319939 RepID=UPI003CE6BF7E
MVEVVEHLAVEKDAVAALAEALQGAPHFGFDVDPGGVGALGVRLDGTSRGLAADLVIAEVIGRGAGLEAVQPAGDRPFGHLVQHHPADQLAQGEPGVLQVQVEVGGEGFVAGPAKDQALDVQLCAHAGSPGRRFR